MAMPLAATVAHEKHGPPILPAAPDAAHAALSTRHGVVTIEEYMYWASITRHEESLLPKVKGPVAKLLGSGRSDTVKSNTRSDAQVSETKDPKDAPPGAVARS